MRFSIRLACLAIGIPTLVYGYIDPFTGSMALQVLIGGVLATLYMVKRSWQQIARLWLRSGSSRDKEESQPNSARTQRT